MTAKLDSSYTVLKSDIHRGQFGEGKSSCSIRKDRIYSSVFRRFLGYISNMQSKIYVALWGFTGYEGWRNYYVAAMVLYISCGWNKAPEIDLNDARMVCCGSNSISI